MLDERLRDAWHAQERAVYISPVMKFTYDGLVLGAGTVLVGSDGTRRLQSLKGQEVTLLALLSAAYGKAVAPAVLGNIERAAKCWSEGDVCLAYIHLAHARLPELQNPREAARCLFIVDRFIKGGTSPRAVFEALGLGSTYIDAVEKLYNPDQPRVPAGNGRASGEWTSDDAGTGETTATGDGTGGDGAQGSSVVGRMSPTTASFLGELDVAEVAKLGIYASRILGPVGAAAAAFGLLFIPSPDDVHVGGDVAAIPGLHYSWNRDETVLHLTYDPGSGAQRTFALQVDGDFIRDDDGQVVGRVIGGNRIAIDTPAVLPDLVKEDEPRLCPAAAPDVAGSGQGKPYEENRPRQYEDFVKLLINPPPDGPTPSGFAYCLPNPAESGKPVSFDDCEKATGTVIEIKGEGLAKLTNDLPDIMADKFVDQATRQMAASGGRPIVWIFAEEGAALFARKLFDETPGLERITVAYVPWTRSQR